MRGRAETLMWLDSGSNAQKLSFQSISRHLKFRVTDIPTYLPAYLQTPLKVFDKESLSLRQKKKKKYSALTLAACKRLDSYTGQDQDAQIQTRSKIKASSLSLLHSVECLQ